MTLHHITAADLLLEHRLRKDDMESEWTLTGPLDALCPGCHGHSLRRDCPVRARISVTACQFLRYVRHEEQA